MRKTNCMQCKKMMKITLIFFFCVKNNIQQILKINHEILIMNYTYKTNKYRMFLIIINKQTILNDNFYIIFCFMTHETQINYIWALIQFTKLYVWLRLFNLIIIVIDMNFVFIATFEKTFSFVTHLLCIWHINNNVFVNCKKHHESQKK